jgi:F-type H+-transporting ATPase subunit c
MSTTSTATTRRAATTRRRQRSFRLQAEAPYQAEIPLLFEEASIVSKRFVLTGALVLVASAFAPDFVLYAQEQPAAGGALSPELVRWSIITAGFALAFAAGLGALGQGKAVASAAEAIARNPGATGDIRGALLLGLVLIESLVIYVLLISLLLFFFNPFRG